MLLCETYQKAGENTWERDMALKQRNSLQWCAVNRAEEGWANRDFFSAKDGRATM
jgi:hypothetical protein